GNASINNVDYYACSKSKLTKFKTSLKDDKDQTSLINCEHTCSNFKPFQNTSLEAAAVAEKRVLDLARDYKLTAGAIPRTIAVDSKRLEYEICGVQNQRKIPAMVATVRGAPERGRNAFLIAPKNALLDKANFLRCDWSGIAKDERHELLDWMSCEAITLLRE
ncbi:hypothetical protein HZS_5719, partial [Henneguya salminicola]